MNTSRGQASIEFVLIISIVLLIMVGIVAPLGNRLIDSLDDVGRTSSVSKASNQLLSAFELMANAPGKGKQILSIFIPAGSQVVCDAPADELTILLPLRSNVFAPDGSVPTGCIQNPSGSAFLMECLKRVPLPSSVDIHCSGLSSEVYAVSSGDTGFTQDFSIGITTDFSASPPFVVDVNVE